MNGMKSMFLSVAVIGAAIAGLILYTEHKNRPRNRVLDAADDAYKTMNKGIGSIERFTHATG
jgi:hypothetical protein